MFNSDVCPRCGSEEVYQISNLSWVCKSCLKVYIPKTIGNHVNFDEPLERCGCGKILFAFLDHSNNRLGLTHPLGEDDMHHCAYFAGLRVLVRDKDEMEKTEVL